MGAGAIVGDIAEKAAGDFVRNAGEFLTKDTGALGFVQSTKALLEKTETGKAFSDFLEHEFEPAARQLGQQKLDAKIAAGVKPAIAAKDAVREAWAETRQQAFGKKDEAVINLIHNATKERGIIHGNAVADAMGIYMHDAQQYWRKTNIPVPGSTKVINLAKEGVSKNPSFQSISETETSLRRALSWMYTPLIAIPHIGQLANIVLDNSLKDVARAVGELSSKDTSSTLKGQILKSGALFDELRYQAIEDAKGTSYFYKLFHHPGFNWLRRQEINLAAVSGKNAALDAASKLERDGSDKWAQYTLGKLGIDPATLREKGFKLSENDILKAMHSEANRTIFLRSGLNTPWRWEESFTSRMMWQYKQFQFRQGAFLSDVFKNSYKHGGLTEFAKAVGTFSLVFPVMGELVHSLENIALGDNPFKRDNKNKFLGNEYFDAMAHAAGFGMFYSLWRAGMWSNFKGYLEGPVFSTFEDLAGDINKVRKAGVYYSEGNKVKARKQLKSASRDIISKGGIPGRLVGHLMQDKK